MRNLFSKFFGVLLVCLLITSMKQNGEARRVQNAIMGDIIIAKCDCGFSQQLSVGGGRLNYQTYCGFPYYCKNCKTLFNNNYLAEEHFCGNCNSADVLPYDNDSLRAHIRDEAVFGWNLDGKTIYLTDDNYLCPQCQNFTLKFSSVGNWD
jgi:RNA polymerase subunit RPABC4/transcription elongation factor Spt4